jgi:hypothetical protein
MLHSIVCEMAMWTIFAFIKKHREIAYFALTFAISWGGALLAIGGAGGMRGTTPTSDPRFAYAVIAMLVGPSLVGLLLTALVHDALGCVSSFRARFCAEWQRSGTRSQC